MVRPMTEQLRAANRRGITAMIAAGAVFLTNDTLVKIASETLPTNEILFIRGVFSIVCIVGLAWYFRDLPWLRDLAKPTVLIRAATDVIATFTYLVALFHIPIANATAINLSSPLLLTAFAAFVLKEQVGWRRWSAVTVGFLGVLAIVRPTAEGFDAYALLAVVGVLFHTMRDLLTRRIDPRTPSIIVSLATAIGVTLASAVGMAFEELRVPTVGETTMLFVASIGLSLGYFLLIVATRAGEVSAVQPFRYMALVWALIAGWTVWGHLPDAWGWLGYALLVGSGLYVFHRERVRAGEKSLKAEKT